MNGKKEIKVASAQNKCKSKKRGKIIIFACLGAIVCLICLGLLFFFTEKQNFWENKSNRSDMHIQSITIFIWRKFCYADRR